MASCVYNARNSRYLPKELSSTTENYETEHFSYNPSTNLLECKLLTKNPYSSFFQPVYPDEIPEHELTSDMLHVIQLYTNSRTNECYIKTNFNLLMYTISANFNDINWIYVNKLRSVIRGLIQNNLKPIYYRGLTLSDGEIKSYLEKQKNFYYTNSFLSFTIDRLLIYPGNAILILKIENSKKNLANIWKWSTFPEEKEAVLAVGSKLQILSVHFFGDKWEIEVELIEDDEQI